MSPTFRALPADPEPYQPWAPTHCPSGHAYTPDNTVTKLDRGQTYRRCKICLKRQRAETRRRRRARGLR